jgi:hypothetical protein
MIQMASGFTDRSESFAGKYVELIILIDYWCMGNSTVNTGCGPE